MGSSVRGFVCAAARGRVILTRAAFSAAALLVLTTPAAAQTSSSVGFVEVRPFVTGLIPVIGPGGAVGGVSIDAQGVVTRGNVETLGRLRDVRLRAQEPVDSELQTSSRMRKVSLRGMQAAIDQRRRAGLSLTDELQNLAGLQRVQYVLVYPEHHDIVLAGSAEGWKVDSQGNVVGQTTGQPVLQLDDLVVALRTAKAAASGDGITCSIDPTKEGLMRLQRLLGTRSLQISDATVARLEQSLGPQQITLTGLPPGSHFARVLVAADFLMKRLAMNFEPAPIDGMPSYMELLETNSVPAPKNTAPRWWLAPRYEPLLKDAGGLAWQLRGSGVQTLTEEGFLGARGTIVGGGKEGPLAKKWADTMTGKYEALSAALPIFAELRNCMDLAVVAALLTKEDLPGKANCDLSLLLDEKRIQVAQYHVPKTLDSKASLVRKGRQWIVSVSGGVDIDSWSVLNRVQTQDDLANTRTQAAAPVNSQRWWWD